MGGFLVNHIFLNIPEHVGMMYVVWSTYVTYVLSSPHLRLRFCSLRLSVDVFSVKTLLLVGTEASTRTGVLAGSTPSGTSPRSRRPNRVGPHRIPVFFSGTARAQCQQVCIRGPGQSPTSGQDLHSWNPWTTTPLRRQPLFSAVADRVGCDLAAAFKAFVIAAAARVSAGVTPVCLRELRTHHLQHLFGPALLPS